MENKPPEQKDLPKPLTGLPKPELEIPAHLASQGLALQNQKKSFHFPKYLFLGIVFLILFTIIGGAYFLGRNSVFKELNPTSPSIPPPDEPKYQGSPTPNFYTESATADWKTYEGDRFSFQYPKDFVFDEEGYFSSEHSRAVEVNENANIGSINISKDVLSLSKCIYKRETYRSVPSTLVNTNNINENGINGLKQLYKTQYEGIEGNGKLYINNYCFILNNKLFTFSLFSYNDLDSKDNKTFDQILSTFKFTEK